MYKKRNTITFYLQNIKIYTTSDVKTFTPLSFLQFSLVIYSTIYCTYVCTYVYIHGYTFAYIYKHIYIHKYIHYVCIYVCLLCGYTYIQIFICMYVYTPAVKKCQSDKHVDCIICSKATYFEYLVDLHHIQHTENCLLTGKWGGVQ